MSALTPGNGESPTMLWQVLIQFVFRLAFGLAAAMLGTSPRWVTSGFFRVHLWVVLGLNTFVGAALSILPVQVAERRFILMLTIVSGVSSYLGSVVWLYEKKTTGRVILLIVTLTNLLGATTIGVFAEGDSRAWVSALDTLTSGLLLGSTFSAMLLGHWYLNTPSMKLEPLRRLIGCMMIAVVLRAIWNGYGLIQSWPPTVSESIGSLMPFVALRWLSGLLGVFAMAWMSMQTLKIPNTQSATGILYVAMIFAFLGELTSQLLSAQTSFPL